MSISFDVKRCAFNETELTYTYITYMYEFVLKEQCICCVLVLYLFGAC